MDIETVIISLIGVFGVLLMILAFGDLYGGEWEAVAQHSSTLIIAIVCFIFVMGGIAYAKGRR